MITICQCLDLVLFCENVQFIINMHSFIFGENIWQSIGTHSYKGDPVNVFPYKLYAIAIFKYFKMIWLENTHFL